MRWYHLVLVASLALGAACSGESGGTPPPPPPPPGPPPPPPPPPPPSQTNQIDIVDTSFNPANVQVGTGTTVTWTGRGNLAHNLTFEDGNGGRGDATSGNASRTFNATGTFRFRCTNHSSNFTSGMSGSVLVQ